jgi:hypothetical protein
VVTKRSVRIASVVAVLVVAFVIANQWRGEPQRGQPKANTTTGAPEEPASSGAQVVVRGTQDSRSASESPSARTSTVDDADEAPKDSVSAQQNLAELVGGIDPLLSDRNLIVRAQDPATKGPGLADVELRFRTEGTDPTWSKQMESKILDQVSRISGLGLVRFDAECRETICRIKLFHPPRTNPLSALEQLKPLGTQLGFDNIVEAATIGEDGVPVSLLYLQRDGA